MLHGDGSASCSRCGGALFSWADVCPCGGRGSGQPQRAIPAAARVAAGRAFRLAAAYAELEARREPPSW